MADNYVSGVRVRVLGRIHGQQTVNVLHFGTHTAGTDTAEPSTMIGPLLIDIRNSIEAALLPAVSSEWVLERLHGQRVHPVLSDEVEILPSGTGAGTGGESSPSFCAQLVNLKTGKGGRSFRGRLFLPPPPETGQQGSKLTAAQLALINTFVDSLRTKFVGEAGTSEFEIGVLSRKLAGPGVGNFNNGINKLSQMIPNSVLATMHSRKIGVGS